MVVVIIGVAGIYNISHASGLTYNQYLSNYYSEDSTLNFYLEECNTPYRTYVETGGTNFESTLAAWEVGTLGAGAATTYTTKQVEFYKLILFDILYQDVSNSTFLKDYEKNIKALNVSCWKSLAELDSTISKSAKVDEELLNKLNNLKVFTKSMKYVSTFTKGLGYVNDAGDLINRICKIEALMNLPDECGEVLTSIMGNTDNLALGYAINEMIEACGGMFTEEQIAAWFTADTVISIAAEECFKGIWDGLLASCGAAGLSIKVGQSVGKLGSNILVGTDKIAEEWYSMKMICDFEDALKKTVKGYQSRYKSNSTDENAVLFNESVRMLYKTMDMGMDYAKDFVKAVRSGGVVNWLYSFFNQTKYDELEKTLGNIQENMNSEMLFVSNYMMNLYLDEYGSSVSANTDVSQEKQEITQEERETIVQQLSGDMIKTSNLVITKNTILTGDWETYGDLEVHDGTLDLNGFTLNVGGNANQPGGYVNVNGGTLNIDGAYNLYEEIVDSATGQSKKIGGGTLQMNNTTDVVNVKGDFVTYGYNGSSPLTAGTLNLYGNFEQIGDYGYFSSSGSFEPGEELCINFLKEGTTKVSFVSTKSYLNNNTHFSSKKVELSGKITGWKLTDNLTVEGEMPAFAGTFDLDGHTMNINGDLNQPDGYVNVNGGTLNIDGAYNLYEETVDSATGQPKKIGGGTLQMNNTTDVVNVKGDFVTYGYNGSSPLTAGTLNLYGNFEQIGDYGYFSSSGSFEPGEELCINFLKEGTTKVSFVSTKSYLNNNTHFSSKKVELSGKITGWKLTDNLTVEGEMPAFAGTFDLDGHTLNINGDLNQPSGTMKLNKGTLKVNGNYNLCGRKINSVTDETEIVRGGSLLMQNVKEIVNVTGDMIVYSSNGSDSLVGGTLYLKGNFTQYGDSYSFRASQYHKTVLTGDATPENKQKITFNHSNCKFHILQLSKPKDCYEFHPEVCWDELNEISGKSIVDAKVELEEESCLYEGKEVCPKVIVTLGGEQLKEDIDFVVSYEGNDKPGTAKIKIEGINCYEGVTEKEFTIICEHKWGEWIVTKEATNTEEGQKEHICQTCGEIEEEVIPILGKQAQVIEGTDHYIKTYGDSNFNLDCILTKGNGVLSYTSDNEKVVSVDAKGTASVIGAGTASITVTAAGTDEYVKTEKVIAVTVNKAEQKFNITYNTDILSVGQTLSIKAESSTGLITYESADVRIANVDNQGVITAKAKGVVQIAVKSAGNNNYQEAVKHVSITVKENEPVNPPEERSFVDVQEGAWYYEYVRYNYMAGIMTGKDDAHFAPDENLARAQFAVILHRMNDEPAVTYTEVFPDVSDDVWYTNAILWANNIGVVTGYSNTGCFGPADNINREQMAVMMYRYANYKGYDTGNKADFNNFSDADRVSAYAEEAMRWAVGNKIISGKNNGTLLDPQGNATRAECATIIMRFTEKFEK